MRVKIQWDDARVFLAIARGGTLSAAAAQLGAGLATVSRRIERLEDALGVLLFSRHQNGYRLTDEGQALLASAEALENAGNAFGAATSSDERAAGTVRLATAENLANGVIVPALSDLIGQNPNLRVEIVTDIQTVNLHRRDADLAIRMVKPQRGNVTIRRLGALGFGLYGSESYIDRRRSPDDAGSFDDDDFIGWAEAYGHLPGEQWIERVLRGRSCILTTTSLAAQLSAASAGMGLAVLPHFMARPAGLKCVADDLGADQAIWLAFHSDLAHSRRVRVVADYLSDLMVSHRDMLLGR